MNKIPTIRYFSADMQGKLFYAVYVYMAELKICTPHTFQTEEPRFTVNGTAGSSDFDEILYTD